MNYKIEFNKASKAYIIMYFACTLCIFLCVFITHGSILSDLLFYDTRDTGMDFFHSIEYVRGRTPYKQFNTLYPPLANLFFYCYIDASLQKIRSHGLLLFTNQLY